MGEEKVPKHVAIVPDGNRRYAKKGGKLAIEGHRAGVKVFDDLLKWCKEFGVKALTFWALSSENLKRDEKEVNGLIKLFNNYCDKFLRKGFLLYVYFIDLRGKNDKGKMR